MNLLQSSLIEIHKLSLNTGQIPDVPKNPRFIRDERFKKLVKSLQDNPEMLPARELLVYNYDGELIVIGGNMRLRAAKELGYKEIPCKILENLTPEQIRAIVIKDNVSFGSDDFEQLANEWDSIELEEWGLEVPTFDEIQPELEAVEDDYTEPENMQVDVCIGDLIEIGQHRLLCGDSTDSEQVAKLMNGEKADMLFTDPPYDCSAGGRHNSYYEMDVGSGKEIKKFNDAGFSFNDFLPILSIIIKSNGNNIIFCGTYTLWNQAMPFCHKNYEVAGIGIWSKPFALSNVRGVGFAKSYEPFVYCWNKPHTFNAKVGIENYDVVNMASNAGGRSYDHPTSKPIKLVEHFLELLSNEKELVADLFLGSGSTMVAAHQLNRKCYGMELDPKYCQVIIDRMNKLDSSLKIKINGKDYIPQTNIKTNV